MSNEQPDGAQQTPGSQDGFPQPGAYASPQSYPTSQPPGYPQTAPQQYPQAYPQQPYQQPYPPAYGQPAQAQPYPGQQPGTPAEPGSPYQITHYAAQYAGQGYQPGYQGQAYPQQAYPAQASYAPPVKAAKSPLLGMIAFGVLVLCVIVGAAAGFQVMQAAATLMAASGMSTTPNPELTQMLQQELMTSFPLQTIALNLTGWGGFAAWVAGIVATATNRGRMWGVLTIILGVITPLIIIAVAFAAMGPALEALR